MDYSTLKTRIADWMHRDDLTAHLDTFIDLFEARAARSLRVPEMEKRATATPAGAYVPLPSDFLEVRNIQINSNPVRLLEYAPPQKIDALASLTGTPLYYSIVGNEFQIHPSAAASEVEIAYYAKPAALSDTNTSNWLIAAHPDYYLFGCLLEACHWALDERAASLSQIVAEKEAAINKRGKDKQYGAGPMVVSAI